MQEEQNLVIPLVEERVSTTTRKVETGRVRIRTRVEERTEFASASLARDEVEITRVPRNEEVDAVPQVREVDGVTIVPVVEEVLVIEKKLVLVEEIHLRRTRSAQEYTQPIVVRAQRAEIEREASSGEDYQPSNQE